MGRVLTAAELCRRSYVDSDTQFTEVEELRFGVIEMNDITFLVFRGTANIRGWLDDFTVVPEQTRTGYLAHKGFIDAADKLWEPVKVAIAGLKNVIMTGHSLGGALAVLFGEYLKAPVISFGCPRVYSRFNGYHLPSMQHTRVINDEDPVPDVPNLLMWTHTCPPISMGHGPVSMEDHDIDLYISRIKERRIG